MENICIFDWNFSLASNLLLLLVASHGLLYINMKCWSTTGDQLDRRQRNWERRMIEIKDQQRILRIFSSFTSITYGYRRISAQWGLRRHMPVDVWRAVLTFGEPQVVAQTWWTRCSVNCIGNSTVIASIEYWSWNSIATVRITNHISYFAIYILHHRCACKQIDTFLNLSIVPSPGPMDS